MIKIGLVGCGIIAQNHLKTWRTIPDAEVVAVADIRPEVAEETARRYAIATHVTDYRRLLEDPEIDVIDVCLHNQLHRQVTEDALRAGKHVYCEKPIAGSYTDGLSMVRTAEECGRRLHIQLALLYSGDVRAAKSLIDAGELGDVYHARSVGHRRRGRPYVDGYGAAPFVSKATAGGGALFDMGVYHISMCLWLMGLPKIQRISGKTYQRIEMDAKRRADSGYDVEEFAAGLVRFENGASLDIAEAWAVNLDTLGPSYVVGDKGGVKLFPFSFHKNIGDVELNATGDSERFTYRAANVGEGGDLYADSQSHFIHALQGRVELLPTARIALDTMLISEGIYLSERLGREVTRDEVTRTEINPD